MKNYIVFQRGTGNKVEIVPHVELTKTFRRVMINETGESYLVFRETMKYRMDEKFDPRDVICYDS